MKLELTEQWKWDALVKAFDDLEKEGVLNSNEWQMKAKNKDISVDEVIWLNTVIASRLA